MFWPKEQQREGDSYFHLSFFEAPLRRVSWVRFCLDFSHEARGCQSNERGEFGAEGKPSQDASRSISKSNEVTITMPVHPLRGETLTLVRVERDRNSGCRFVLAETQEGRRLRIPESWTDRCVFERPHQIDGREAKLVLSGLLCLADVVADMGKSRKVDIGSGKLKKRRDTEQKASCNGKSKGCPMAGAAAQDTGRSARGICRPGAQDPSCRDGDGRRRGGK
jgi:hypothetical protein